MLTPCRMYLDVKVVMKVKSAAIGVWVVGAALSSSALTLGPARGAAWIGQPLDLSAVVQLEPGQSAASLCAEADVFHADNKQDLGRVKVTAEPGDQPETARLRVVSTSLVDEPVVTVYLRAGCAAKSTRRYVLLADYPGEVQALEVRVAAPIFAASGTLTPPLAGASANGDASRNPAEAASLAPPAAKPKPKPKSAPRKLEASAPKAKLAPVKSKPATPAAGQDRPRLRLDPLESLEKRISSLESTPVVAPPVEVSREEQLMLQLQSELKAFSEKTAKNEALLLTLREQLAKAEADKTPAALLYGLMALVLLCLVAIAVLWSRRSEASAWRSGLVSSKDSSKTKPEVAAAVTPVAGFAPAVKPQAAPAEPAKSSEFSLSAAAPMAPHDPVLDLNLAEMDDDSFNELMNYDWGNTPVSKQDKPTK